MKKFVMMIIMIFAMLFVTNAKEYQLQYPSEFWTKIDVQSDTLVDVIINNRTNANLVKCETNLSCEQYVQEGLKDFKQMVNNFNIINNNYKRGKIISYNLYNMNFVAYQKTIIRDNIAWTITITNSEGNIEDLYHAIDDINLI